MTETKAEKETGPTKDETLFGGTDYIISTGETVRIRQLPVSEYPRLMAATDDEQRQIDIYCGNPDGFGATLHPRDHNAIITEAERLNADFFEPWAARRMKTLNRLLPGRAERLFDEATKSLQDSGALPPAAK